VLGGAQPLGGKHSRLDALGQLDFLLGAQQGDLADLVQIEADRVRRGGQLGVLAGLAQRLGLFLVPQDTLGVLPGVRLLSILDALTG
jgi:hypothetical protein